MGSALSPILAYIFMCKLKEEVVTPRNLPIYDRYVDVWFTKRKTNAPNRLLENLSGYHLNIKFPVEEDPKHFLHTSFEFKELKLVTKVYKNQGNYKSIGNPPFERVGNVVLS